MRFKEVFLGAGSMLHGRSAYMFFGMPEKWEIVPSYATPEALLMKAVNDQVWVIVGSTSAVILADDKDKIKRPIVLKVRVDDRKHFSHVDEWLSQRKQGIREKTTSVLKDAGKVGICQHQGAYVIWVENKKRYGIFGQRYSIANVLCSFRCEDTNREIVFKLRSKYPDVLVSNKPIIKRILSSIACHQRIRAENEAVGEDTS